MENSIQIAVQQTKTIETLLAKKFSAVGGGLTQKIKSIEYFLEPRLVKDIKEVARIRNNVVHQDGSALDDPDSYIEKCQKILAALNETAPFKLELKSLLEITAPCELLQKAEEESVELPKKQDVQEAHPPNKKERKWLFDCCCSASYFRYSVIWDGVIFSSSHCVTGNGLLYCKWFWD